ncbi:TPA: O-antigen ligase family protein [Streptococcus suis]
MAKKFSVSKLYTWALVLLPLVSIYGISEINFDFGTLVLLLLLPFVIHEQGKIVLEKQIVFPWLLYAIYIVISLYFPTIFGKEIYLTNGSVYVRAFKNILYIFILVLSTSRGIIDKDYFVQIYLKVTKICTCYIFIQVVLYYTIRFNLPGYINMMLVAEGYGERLDITSFSLFRPTSLFYEPAHFFEYVIIGVIIYLFRYKDTPKNDIFNAIFLALGIVLSTSGMGILTIAGILVFWLLQQLSRTKFIRVRKEMFFLIVIGLIAVAFFLQSGFGQSVLSRLFSTGTNYSALDGRTEIYERIFSFDIGRVLLGSGYGNVLEHYFYPAWAFNLWCLGIVGSSIIVILYLRAYFHSRVTIAKIIVLVNFMLCFVSTLFMGKNLLFYFLFIYILSRADEEQYE